MQSDVTIAGPFNILLVDDDQATRILLTRILQQPDYVFTEADHGNKALDLLEKSCFDLLSQTYGCPRWMVSHSLSGLMPDGRTYPSFSCQATLRRRLGNLIPKYSADLFKSRSIAMSCFGSFSLFSPRAIRYLSRNRPIGWHSRGS